MLDEMKKRSDGRISYSMYAGGALGKGPDHFDIVKTGLSDMGYATLSWTPGTIPLDRCPLIPHHLPGQVERGRSGEWPMYDKMLHSEFEDVKVLHINNCVMAHLWTTKKVTTMEDLKGMKIRSPGGLQTRAIQALGAVPVFIAPGGCLPLHGDRCH